MVSRKEQVMQSVRSELALANAQELMNSANKACFQKCITKPGGSLSSSEETCLDRCLGRYMDACAWFTFYVRCEVLTRSRFSPLQSTSWPRHT